MSVEAITWALKQPIERSSAKFVLVVMANCADGKEFLAWPSTGYLAECTSQDRKTVLKNIGVLLELGLISDTGERKGDTKQIPVYRLNSAKNGTVKTTRNSTENGTVSDPSNSAEIGTVKESQKRNSTENGTVPFFPSNSTVFPLKQSQKRDTETSEPSGKQKTSVEPLALPEWLPADAWSMWDEFRAKKSGKGWTDTARRLSIRKLGSLREAGHQPVAVIEQSIEHGWTGLFEIKVAFGAQQKPAQSNRFAGAK